MPPLTVAGSDPLDQFLVAELVGISLAVIDISAIDFAMPQDALLRRHAHRRQKCEVLLVGIPTREVDERTVCIVAFVLDVASAQSSH